MRRFPVLFWLATLASVFGRPAAPAAATAFALRTAAATTPEHALPTSSRVRLAATILPSPERARPGGSTTHAATGASLEPDVGGLRSAGSSDPVPVVPCGGPAALSYFPTGPPLLV
jgi:hypothetical protein